MTAAGLGFSGGSVVKNPPANAGHSGDVGSVAGSGSFPRGGNDTTPVFLPGKSPGQGRMVGL